eukprot:COSAG02_NODE_35071_length_474_cov_0.832000_1_plen_64_part_10
MHGEKTVIAMKTTVLQFSSHLSLHRFLHLMSLLSLLFYFKCLPQAQMPISVTARLHSTLLSAAS